MFMCPAVHMSTRILRRSSSTHVPSDPPFGVVIAVGRPAYAPASRPRRRPRGLSCTPTVCGLRKRASVTSCQTFGYVVCFWFVLAAYPQARGSSPAKRPRTLATGWLRDGLFKNLGAPPQSPLRERPQLAVTGAATFTRSDRPCIVREGARCGARSKRASRSGSPLARRARAAKPFELC